MATKRTEAHRKADAKYRKGRTRVPLDFNDDDPDLALLEGLAKGFGSRKAAIVAALRALAASPGTITVDQLDKQAAGPTVADLIESGHLLPPGEPGGDDGQQDG